MTGRLSEAGLLLAESRLHRFREDYGVRQVPVDCFRLLREIRASGRIEIEWQESGSFSERFDASAVYFPSERCYAIFSRTRPFNWKRYSSGRRCNFTMAHELGHIFCGHLALPASRKDPETIRTEEMEADAFAAGLLMPAEVLGQFRSAEEASDALWVSVSAVRRRLAETGIRLEKRTCTRCGFDGIPPNARYCRRCGCRTGQGPEPAPEPEIVYVPPLQKECPACGQRAFGPERECVNCGLPRRNTCMPEYNLPPHYAPADALYCEACGSQTVYSP